MRQCGQKKNKTKQKKTKKKTISGWGHKGKILGKWFSSNSYQLKAFHFHFYVLRYRFWVNEFIPTIEITVVDCYITWKTILLIDFREEGASYFFFRWLCNPHLRSKSEFEVLDLKKITKTTYYESLRTFARVISSL